MHDFVIAFLNYWFLSLSFHAVLFIVVYGTARCIGVLRIV